jgi:hypothetical protein
VAVTEENVILAKETGFQEVSEDARVELLESRSAILKNEELAELDRRTYKEAQGYHGDDESATSE